MSDKTLLEKVKELNKHYKDNYDSNLIKAAEECILKRAKNGHKIVKIGYKSRKDYKLIKAWARKEGFSSEVFINIGEVFDKKESYVLSISW